MGSFLESIRKTFEPYTKRGNQKEAAYEPQTCSVSTDGAVPVSPEVRLPTSTSTALPVTASRIKWKLAPSFDPTPFLTDPVVKKAFLDPNVLRRPERDWPALPRAKVHADKEQVFALAVKWDSLGACSLVSCDTVNPRESVGIFAVPKDAEFDRLILNPTMVNSRSYPCVSFTKTIAPGYLMSLIRLAADEDLVVSSDDLCEFYYTFKVSPHRARRSAIGMVFKGSDFAGFKCFNPQLADKDVYICLSTLAMGDALAVEIAQQSHVNVLRKLACCMKPAECLLYRQPIPRGPFYELLTIDDHIGLQKIKKDGSEAAAHQRDRVVFDAANKAYSHVKLTAHPGKMRRREPHAVVLGAEIEGTIGRCSAPRERIALLSFIASMITHKRLATRKLLQGLLGCWTHVLLFRRPLFALLEVVYHEGETLPADVVFHMSQKCLDELTLLCLLAPVMQTDLRTSIAPELFMLDASPYGGGICFAPFTASAADELWRHSEQRGYYTRLQSEAGATLRELGLEHEEFFGEEACRFDLGASQSDNSALFAKISKSYLVDKTQAFDCIELFSGQGNWSSSHTAVGFKVHPGVERSASGKAFGDLANNETFRDLAALAYRGAIREWHAGPPCWSFGTLRRPRLRSKQMPAGFQMTDPKTREQTLLAVRTAF